MEKDRKKPEETFLVKIMDDQNATWQGTITWIEEDRTEYFRSALELIKMIDGVIEKKNAIGGEDHEK